GKRWYLHFKTYLELEICYLRFLNDVRRQKYKNFTAADIERYHKGLLSPEEMHAVEKAALDDPFLADALEGYGGASTNAAADLSELEKKLQQRISESEEISIAPIRNSFKW